VVDLELVGLGFVGCGFGYYAVHIDGAVCVCAAECFGSGLVGVFFLLGTGWDVIGGWFVTYSRCVAGLRRACSLLLSLRRE
jgi:hypothetical protein